MNLPLPSLLAPTSLLVAAAFLAPSLQDEAEPAAEAVVEEPESEALEVTFLWTIDERRSHVFALAEQGRFREALVVAEAMLADDTLGHKSGRIDRLHGRLVELQVLRMDYLTSLQEQGARLKFEREGKKVSATVLAVTESTIQFESNKRVPAELPISDLGLEDLSKLTRRLDPKLGSAASRALLDVLAGDEHWEKRLNREMDEGEQRSILRVDLLDVIRLVGDGQVVEKINSLGAGELGPDQLAALGELMASHGNHPLVTAKRTQLRALCRPGFIASFTPENIAEALSATKVTVTGNEIRMNYTFDSGDELRDFVACESTPSLKKFPWWNSQIKEEKWHSIVTRAGWNVLGDHNFRHPVSLAPPVSLELGCLTGELPVTETRQLYSGYVMTLCDDLEGNYVVGAKNGWDFGYSVEGDLTRELADYDRLTSLEQVYHTAMSLEDGVAKIFFEGEEAGKAEGCKIGPGYIQFGYRANHPMEIKSVTIQGILDEASYEDLAALYAERKLEALGL